MVSILREDSTLELVAGTVSSARLLDEKPGPDTVMGF
jgi:hypothetical protein